MSSKKEVFLEPASLFLTRLSWSQVFDDERYISANVGIEQVVKYEYVGIL